VQWGKMPALDGFWPARVLY